MKNNFIAKLVDKERERLPLLALFSALTIALLVAFTQWLCAYISTDNFYQFPLFQRVTGIAFSDFFHVNDMVNFNSPYFEDSSSYPPLVLLFAKLFNGMADYSNGYLDITEQVSAIVSLVLYYAIFFVFTTLIVVYYLRKKGFSVPKIIAVLVLFYFSAPMIFQFERGNYIIYALLFSLIFFVFYNHENPILRECAYVALGITVGIKLYPALFAAILLKNKKFVEFFRCVAYSLIFLFVPFLFFESGLSNIERFIYWLTDFSGTLSDYAFNYSIASSIQVFVGLFTQNLQESSFVLFLQKVLPLLCLIFCMVAALFANKEWKTFALVAVVIIQFPNISFAYTLSFLLIPMLSFVTQSKYEKKDYLFAFLFFLLVAPSFFGYVTNYFRDIAISNNQIISSLALIALSLILLIEELLPLIHFIKSKFNRKVS